MRNAESLGAVAHAGTRTLSKLTLQSSGVFVTQNIRIKSKVMHSK